MLNEADIIESLKVDFPQYIGDDAAVIKTSDNQNYVITKDILVEDIHFRASYFDPSSLAQKALHVNLSDIAAMGAEAKFVVLGIAIPTSQEIYVKEFLKSFSSKCKEANVILIGGDTSKSLDKLFISITVIGLAGSGSIKNRSNAQEGDLLCVVGDYGSAHLGFIACERFINGFDQYKENFLRPTAKKKEGLWLGNEPYVTSMMDISDGLFIDLEKLCLASNLQGVIDLKLLNSCSSILLKDCDDLGLKPLEVMLSGGEDYSLLFTVNKNNYNNLAMRFEQNFGYKIKNIGHISKGKGVRFLENGLKKALTINPFTHFGEL